MGKILPGLALAWACGTSLVGSSLAEDNKKSTLRFYIHIYNYAHISTDILARAEEETTRLFLHAGVEPVWVPCPVSQDEAGRYPECRATPGLVLNIRPEAGLKTTQKNHEYGFAVNTTAYVFAGSLAGIVQTGLASWPVMLGHVMAHEVGHVLLGPDSHSPDGVMRARLGPEDWRRAAVGQLFFNPSQREGIQTAVVASSYFTKGRTKGEWPAVSSDDGTWVESLVIARH